MKRGFSVSYTMGYWRGDKTNWELDRRGRRKVFDLMKQDYNPAPVKKDDTKETHDLESFPRKTKFNWLLPVLGAILKIGGSILIFYAFAMIISYGKRWPG